MNQPPDIGAVLTQEIRRQTPQTIPDLAAIRAQAARARRTHLMAAAAAVVVAAGSALVSTTTSLPWQETTSEPGPTGPLAGEDPGALCVEIYDTPADVDRRSFAFDGTVTDVVEQLDLDDPHAFHYYEVIFEVNEWFKGGEGDAVGIAMSSGPGVSYSNDGPPVNYAVGSRLLISGEPMWGGEPLDDPIAWPCGFSRYYDPETARGWREATSGG